MDVALYLDQHPHDAYGRVPLPVAQWADQVFDWLQEEPIDVRGRRHRFTTGEWAVTAHIQGEDWLVLWEPAGSDVRVRYLGENTLGT